MSSSRLLATWAPALALSLFAAGASAATLTEGFDVVTPAGWTNQNNSTTVGTTSWFLGNEAIFAAHEGPATSYAGANFNSIAGAGTISTWLISPTLSFNNGDVISFWTRTEEDSIFADRLELRFSAVGGTDVGSTATSTGTFDLLLTVNPTLAPDGYPSVWTQYTATISGLSGTTDGAIAFRYFVTDVSPAGSNGNYIGIDTLSITAVPEPASYLMMALGVAGLLLRRSRAERA